MKDNNYVNKLLKRKQNSSNAPKYNQLTLDTLKKFDVDLVKIQSEVAFLDFGIIDYEEKRGLSVFGEKKAISYLLSFVIYNVEFQAKLMTFEYNTRSELLKLDLACKTLNVEKEIKYCCNSLQRRRNLNLMFLTLIKFTRFLESRRIICDIISRKNPNIETEENKDGGKIIIYSNSTKCIKLGVFWNVECNSQHEVVDKVEAYYKVEEKNEIPYEKDDQTKMYKSSGKPALVIEESQYEIKTSSHEIKERILKSQESEVQEQTLNAKADNSSPELREEIFGGKSFAPFICPHKDAPKPLFSLPCFSNNNCGFLGRDMLCCDGRCLKGIKPPKGDPHHDPIFFGIIERKCPAEPLTELSEVKECITDDECSPRICCGETSPTGEKARYCRTPIPVWDTLPLPSPVLEPLKTITSYMQCTPPPPAHLDLYPKTCQNLMDCFPNLCCQEKGKKFCRPPKRSLLALVAELGQKIIPEDAARKFIERLS